MAIPAYAGEKRKGQAKEDRLFRWLSIGTEIPIMVFLGALIGYELGRRFDSHYELEGFAMGALTGLLASIAILFRRRRTPER